MREPPQYTVAHLRRALAEDPRTCELGIRVTIRGETVIIDGEVESEHRRGMLETVVRELLPRAEVHNEVRIGRCDAPDHHEGQVRTDPSDRDRS
ncbi:BON domain-containing protein [Nocardia arizonensis]|uniref:BON domain-containing protein n=1 Tax=Nocardia arizonensis TaxID=1141647 RepID=UPI0007A73113|nr:BON domain-containing protein [Nocardia arizonensis]